MEFRIETKLNDGKVKAPACDVEVLILPQLINVIEDEMKSDEGVIIGIGASITITRVA